METFVQASVASLLISIAAFALSLLIFWLLVRGAVLSALRQYRAEAPKNRLDPLA